DFTHTASIACALAQSLPLTSPISPLRGGLLATLHTHTRTRSHTHAPAHTHTHTHTRYHTLGGVWEGGGGDGGGRGCAWGRGGGRSVWLEDTNTNAATTMTKYV